MKSARKKSIAVSSSFKPEIEPFEEIAAQANEYCPNPASLEDIMTEQEIESAFNELDEINRRFSAKTNIVNKTDLAFLSIATALQGDKVSCFSACCRKIRLRKNSDQLKKKDLITTMSRLRKSTEKQMTVLRRNISKSTGKGIGSIFFIKPFPTILLRDRRPSEKTWEEGITVCIPSVMTRFSDGFFGTANILTDCITFNNFQTNRVIRVDPITGGKR